MTEVAPAVRSTGIGSWPDSDFGDAVKISLAECPELPYFPELPARGAHAQLIGRSTAFLASLAVDLQPAGWRLTDGSGRDHRLAQGLLRQDLDQLEEHAQGYTGPLKFAVAGPWTLAAMMERPRGDKVLADAGARRDVAQSLAEGIAQFIGDVRRRLPDIEPILQLDEPLLPRVLAGEVATASGFSKHRTVDVPEVSDTFTELIDHLSTTSGVECWVHCCADGAPVGLLHRAGASGVLIDLDRLTTAAWDQIGVELEAGLLVGAGAVVFDQPLTADAIAAKVVRPLRQVGLDPERSTRQLVITPSCGLASATRDSAIATLRAIRKAAEIVTEQLTD